MDRKCPLSEPKASFGHFPFFAARKREKEFALARANRSAGGQHAVRIPRYTPAGASLRGRLSLLTFFDEAKKVSGRRATPGQFPRSATSQ